MRSCTLMSCSGGHQPRTLSRTRTEPSGGNAAEILKAKRLGIMQDFIEGRAPHQCWKCNEWNEKYATDRKRFFIEVEHLRRGIQKLLDQCAGYMSVASFRALKESLQLNVRFFSEHTDDCEASPSATQSSPAVRPPPADPYDRESLQTEISRLEVDVARLEKENLQLHKEITKNEGKLLRATGGRSIANRVISTEVQTDPVVIGAPKRHSTAAVTSGNRALDDDNDSESIVTPRPASQQAERRSTAAPSRSRAPQPEDDGDGLKERKAVARTRASVAPAEASPSKRARSKGKGGGEGEDRSKELQRMKDEMDALRRKLAIAQKDLVDERAKAPPAKLQTAEVQLVVQEKTHVVYLKDKEREVPTAEAAKTDVAAVSSNLGGTAEKEKEPRAHAEAPPKRRLVGRSPSRSSTESQGTITVTEGEQTGHTGTRATADSGSRDPAVIAAANPAGLMDIPAPPPKPVLVDKCVGNGPGPGLQDDPVRCRGKALLPPPAPELNTNGAAFKKTLRAEPDLGGLLIRSTGSPKAASREQLPPASERAGSRCASPERTASPLPEGRKGPPLERAASTGSLRDPPAGRATTVSASREPRMQRTAPAPLQEPQLARAPVTAARGQEARTLRPGSRELGPGRSPLVAGQDSALGRASPVDAVLERASSDVLQRQMMGRAVHGKQPFQPGAGCSVPMVQIWPNSGNLAATCTSSAQGSRTEQAWCETEPYLLHVWEQHPLGHKQPSREELANLRAFSPPPPTLPSMQRALVQG